MIDPQSYGLLIISVGVIGMLQYFFLDLLQRHWDEAQKENCLHCGHDPKNHERNYGRQDDGTGGPVYYCKVCGKE